MAAETLAESWLPHMEPQLAHEPVSAVRHDASEDREMIVIYVVTWRYGDGSGSGAVAAFPTEAGAEKLLEILNKQDSMRNYKIEPVPFDMTQARGE